MTRLPRPAAALAALALVQALAGCGDEEEPARAADASTPPAEERPVSAYFVGDTPLGPRLFGEEGSAPGADDLAAALAAVEDAPADPDYRTALEPGVVDAVAFDGVGDDGVIEVTLHDDGWVVPPPGMSEAEATLAVQQLVYTLQAAAGGDTGPVRAPVEFYLDGTESSFLGVESGVTAAPQTRVLALVNVLAPSDGAAVPGDTLHVEGLASSFEANVPWQVLDASGDQVLQGFSTAEGWGRRLYPWTAEVDLGTLPPGEYTFVARTDDPSGGEGGGPTEDTKAFTVS